MIITDLLERNASEFPKDTALVEINPLKKPEKYVTWKEYSLIEPSKATEYRREINWEEFNKSSNRFANMLLSKGVKKKDKVAILLMNSLEWLPIYFGILKTGALAVPLNYRYTQDEIKYCLELAECSILVFGFEFIGRVESIFDTLTNIKHIIYVGEDIPSFAESYDEYINLYTSRKPNIELNEDDDAAIYFSSGTTGFPKAILHTHKALINSAITEQNHHSQTKNDCFLCIPPLYHTGAKMHWFGSLYSGSKAVLLRGVKPEWILHHPYHLERRSRDRHRVHRRRRDEKGDDLPPQSGVSALFEGLLAPSLFCKRLFLQGAHAAPCTPAAGGNVRAYAARDALSDKSDMSDSSDRGNRGTRSKRSQTVQKASALGANGGSLLSSALNAGVFTPVWLRTYPYSSVHIRIARPLRHSVAAAVNPLHHTKK